MVLSVTVIAHEKEIRAGFLQIRETVDTPHFCYQETFSIALILYKCIVLGDFTGRVLEIIIRNIVYGIMLYVATTLISR